MNHLTGPTVVRLMRTNGSTIRSLAAASGVSQQRVRAIRNVGVVGALDAWGWVALIAGREAADNIGATVARLYL